jgi:sugar/nucleoside kinase (ribokinase family)
MDILLTGSVAYDYLMTFPGHFKEHLLAEHLEKISLSFLVESLVRRRGGIAPNIAYTLALLGGKPRVMAPVGEDFEEYRAWLDTQGVDTTLMKVVPGKYTSSYFATTDRSNAQVASFYPGAMEDAGTLSLHDLKANGRIWWWFRPTTRLPWTNTSVSARRSGWPTFTIPASRSSAWTAIQSNAAWTVPRRCS